MTPQIDGYEILQHLARGGMGRVYLARSTGPGGFERHVVIKTLDVDTSENVAMFLDEARVIGRMHHQHIAPAFAVGRDREGRYFLVMDYIHGRSAAEIWEHTLDLDAALPIDFVITVVAAAASALHYAHTRTARDGSSLSIVHRDVSLTNVMIGHDGAVKLIDFGIAKAADSSTLTQVGFVKGKLGYVAPEQVNHDPVDRRADIFALGVVLYELATMTRAFREEDDFTTLRRIKNCEYLLPSRVVSDFPRGLEVIIAKALQRDPADRYQDAETLRRELETFGIRNKLVMGESAIVEVMRQLFENRDEPWLLTDGTPGDLDDGTTVPIDTTVDRAAPRPAAPRSGARGLRAATEIIELTVRKQARDEDTPTSLLLPAAEAPPYAPRPSAIEVPAMPSLASSSRGRALAIVCLILVVCGIAGIATWTLMRSKLTAPPQDAAAIVPDASLADAAIDSAPAADAAPATIHIRIVTKPADATVLLDGDRLGRTPFETEIAPRAGPHVIKVRRRGYVSQTIDVELTADLTREIVLERSGSR